MSSKISAFDCNIMFTFSILISTLFSLQLVWIYQQLVFLQLMDSATAFRTLQWIRPLHAY